MGRGIVRGTVLEAYTCKSYEIMKTSTQTSKTTPPGGGVGQAVHGKVRMCIQPLKG